MQAAYARDMPVKRLTTPDAASSFYWNPGVYPNVATTQGSRRDVHSPQFPAGSCYGVASGTAVVVQGSAVLTALAGSFVPPAGTSHIILGGTNGGAR